MQYNKSANLRRWQSVGGVRLARPLPPPLPRLWYRSSRGRSENGLESSAHCCWLANPHLAGLRLASPSPSLPFRQSILCHLSLSLPPPVRLRHMSCSPLSQCLFQASFFWGGGYEKFPSPKKLTISPRSPPRLQMCSIKSVLRWPAAGITAYIL